MISFTLDTNCLIDVDERREAAVAVEFLLEASLNGRADVALVASSASERQRDVVHPFLSSFQEFDTRRRELGFGNLEILLPLARFGISFWDNALWSGEEPELREQQIFEALFPNSHYFWKDYAQAARIDVSDDHGGKYFSWRNRILDAQAFWSHDHKKRQVFVTSDKNFRTKLTGGLFHSASILNPLEAVELFVCS